MRNSRTAEKSSAIFVDDGGEDAYEFASNYIWFDPSDPEDVRRAWSEAHTLWHDRRRRVPVGALYDIEAPRLHGEEPLDAMAIQEPVAWYLQSA